MTDTEAQAVAERVAERVRPTVQRIVGVEAITAAQEVDDAIKVAVITELEIDG